MRNEVRNSSDILTEAKERVAKKQLEKAVTALEEVWERREDAQTILNNIDREISELELKISQGNI